MLHNILETDIIYTFKYGIRVVKEDFRETRQV